MHSTPAAAPRATVPTLPSRPPRPSMHESATAKAAARIAASRRSTQCSALKKTPPAVQQQGAAALCLRALLGVHALHLLPLLCRALVAAQPQLGELVRALLR